MGNHNRGCVFRFPSRHYFPDTIELLVDVGNSAGGWNWAKETACKNLIYRIADRVHDMRPRFCIRFVSANRALRCFGNRFFINVSFVAKNWRFRLLPSQIKKPAIRRLFQNSTYSAMPQDRSLSNVTPELRAVEVDAAYRCVCLLLYHLFASRNVVVGRSENSSSVVRHPPVEYGGSVADFHCRSKISAVLLDLIL